MIPIAVGVFVGGAAFIGVSSTASNRKRVKKRRLVEVLNGKPLEEDTRTFGERFTAAVANQSPILGKWLVSTGTSLEKWDNDYQVWVKRHIDPRLAGRARDQYLSELSAGRELCLSPEEKAINRQMLLGGVSLGVLGMGAVAGLPWVAPLII
ncbi:MAG: hypothetical protein WBM66_11290, partial [Thiothrix litoralis]